MQIISLDTLEQQTVTPTWGNLDAKFSQIKNSHDLGFSCNQHLSLSQHLYYEQHSTNSYQNVCVLYIPFVDNFCHNLIDFLPELLDLERSEKYDLILAPHSRITDNFIDSFNIEFKKIKFIKTNFNFISQTIDLYQYNINQRRVEKSLKLREILLKKIKITSHPDKLIYCTRNSGEGTLNGRKMNASNEAEIIELSRDYAHKYGLEFVVFDGGNEDGSRMSILDQANLFSQSKIVVGPHGGAFANIIYIPADNNCKVCEFTSGKHTAVQEVTNFGKNYNRLLGFAPDTYLDYYLIPFEIGSDKNETYIDINNYKYFLNSIKL